jgi:hypothetical protein
MWDTLTVQSINLLTLELGLVFFFFLISNRVIIKSVRLPEIHRNYTIENTPN